MNKIIKTILKFFYRCLIFKVIVVDRLNFSSYNKLKTFCEYELMSNMGPIQFIFKKDRRNKRRKFDNFLFINTYLIELKVQDNVIVKREEINNKIVIVTKVIIFKVNYEILIEVLLDLYIDNIIKLIQD